LGNTLFQRVSFGTKKYRTYVGKKEAKKNIPTTNFPVVRLLPTVPPLTVGILVSVSSYWCGCHFNHFLFRSGVGFRHTFWNEKVVLPPRYRGGFVFQTKRIYPKWWLSTLYSIGSI